MTVECSTCANATTVNAEAAEAAITEAIKVLAAMEKAVPSSSRPLALSDALLHGG